VIQEQPGVEIVFQVDQKSAAVFADLPEADF